MDYLYTDWKTIVGWILNMIINDILWGTYTNIVFGDSFGTHQWFQINQNTIG